MKNVRKISNNKIYVTVLCENASVGDYFLLTKDKKNSYDEEAIIASFYFETSSKKSNSRAVVIYDDEADYDYFVANSVQTVARGTYSAGRIYDKFDKKLIVKVKFALKRAAICEVIGEPVDKKPSKKSKNKKK